MSWWQRVKPVEEHQLYDMRKQIHSILGATFQRWEGSPKVKSDFNTGQRSAGETTNLVKKLGSL
jgi:hypothetical protein